MSEASPPVAEEVADDLYTVLGVHRDASKLAIAQAYREKARIYHPDVPETGDKAKFNQLRLARDVLTNPRWRENYDAVGAIPKDEADNAAAELLTVLTGQFGQVMHAVLSEGKDPTNGDFVAAMQNSIKNGFQSVNTNITAITASLEQLNKIPGRFQLKNFDQPNHMEVVVNGQKQQLEKQLEQLRATLRQLENARVYLNDVTFKQGAL